MMEFSMKDPRWSNMGIGLPMRKFGCYVVSLSCILGITPDNVLNKLMENNCFTDNGSLLNYKAMEVLGYSTYEKLLPNTEIKYPIIAETDHYAPLNYPQHFFVMVDKDNCLDPLDGLTKPNIYNIVSYRLFS